MAVRIYPIESFTVGQPGAMQFGRFRFLGGIEIAASHRDFGGISGLIVEPDGERFLAISDSGSWISGRFVERGARLAGVEDLRIAPMRSASGRPLARTRSRDTEALTLSRGEIFVSVERSNEILRFDWLRQGAAAPARPVPVPAGVKDLPRNRGLEALAVMPAGGPHAGSLLAIAERSAGADEPTAAFLIGPRGGPLQVARSRGFDVTDAAFLPSGDMLLLERWYSPLRGVAMRLRRIARAGIVPGATLDGPVVLEADLGFQIDNMEAIAIHVSQAGETIVTLMSDDNFSVLQRTIALRFAYQE